MSYSCIRDCGNEQFSRTSVIRFLFSPVSCYEPDSLKSTLCCSLSCSLILSDHTHTTVSEISNLCTHIHVPFELQTILHLLTYHYTCIYVSSINRSSQVKGSHQRTIHVAQNTHPYRAQPSGDRWWALSRSDVVEAGCAISD